MEATTIRMYDLEEVMEAVEAWEQAISGRMAQFQCLRGSGLTLKQTCGWPLVTGLRGQCQVVAVPTYNVPGCQGHHYSSFIIQKKKTTRPDDWTSQTGLTAAINSRNSCSGYLLLGAAIGKDKFERMVVEEIFTGSHLKSFEAVANGDADIAAIDCVTFAHFAAHRPKLLKRVDVVATSPTCLALPYVTEIQATPVQLKAIREAIYSALKDPQLESVRRDLFIDGFEFEDDLIRWETYDLAITGLMQQVVVDIWPPPPQTPLDQDRERQKLVRLRPLDTFCLQLAVKSLKLACSKPKQKFTYVLLGDQQDQRVARVHFPGGTPINPWNTGQELRNCVGFFGDRPRLHETTLEDNEWYWKCWQADEAIVDAFNPSIIAAYVTGETSPGGNSFNLVVFADNKTAGDFRGDSKVHRAAVDQVAPYYYKKVRIHRCHVSETAVVFDRTLVVHYCQGTAITKGIIQWAN